MVAVLRGYQSKAHVDVREAWVKGARNVCLVLPTGSGKSLCAMSLAAQLPGNGVVQAHRAELVGQLSIALGEQGVRHNLTVSDKVRRQIIDSHVAQLGRSYYDPQANWSVESVDTAIKRPARPNVEWVIVDEAAHVLRDNKWGKAMAMYPQARGLLLTATPCRTDGKGLGAHADGVANAIVVGPGLARMMAEGYLCEYDIKTSGSVDVGAVAVGSNGDFNQRALAAAVHADGEIVGNAVSTYLEHAAGKLCITFAVDIEHARELCAQYIAHGVTAEVVTGEDLSSHRVGAMNRFRARETMVLINVDLFGEGVDVPGVEVVQMCRPTCSFNLYTQMIGRMLRLAISRELQVIWDTLTPAERRSHIAASAKPRAILLDHAGNVGRQFKVGDGVYTGPPEGFTAWTLDGRTRGGGGGGVATTTCTGCYLVYERAMSVCPYCETERPPPEGRRTVEHTEGDLTAYDPDILNALRLEAARIYGPPVVPYGAPPAIAGAVRKRWIERQESQATLRDTIAHWAGARAGVDDATNYRRFYRDFGIDVATAVTLSSGDAIKLTERIKNGL